MPGVSNETANANPVSTASHSLAELDRLTLVEFVEKNAKIFAVLLIAVVVGGLAYVGYQSLKTRWEASAQEAFYVVEVKYNKLRDEFDRAKMNALMPDEKKEKETLKAASGDIEKDYGSLIQDLEKVARDHAGTSGGAQAAILAAETYLLYNQPEKAAAIVEVPVKELPKAHLLSNLSRVLLGNALANKGDCQSAVGVWQQALDEKNATFLHPEVSLRSGLCYEKLNQPEKAAEMYRRSMADGPESAAGSTAKGLLRALELKTKTQSPQQG